MKLIFHKHLLFHPNYTSELRNFYMLGLIRKTSTNRICGTRKLVFSYDIQRCGTSDSFYVMASDSFGECVIPQASFQ